MKKIAVVILLYLTYLLLVFSVQRYLLFPGQNLKPPAISEKSIPGLEIIWLETSFGRVEAWYFSVDNSVVPIKPSAVIFAHGNAELIDYCYSDMLRYNKLGINLLAVEYPGYGRSQGSPSQESISEAFSSAYDWLIKNGDIDPDKIIVHGRSVGGGAACLLAKNRGVRALILQSTFTDVKQFAIHYFAPPFLVRDPFDNLSVVKAFNGPILIFHGENDQIIPYGNGLELNKNSRNAKMITLKCRHNDCPPDRSVYWESIRKFLKENNIIL